MPHTPPPNLDFSSYASFRDSQAFHHMGSRHQQVAYPTIQRMVEAGHEYFASDVANFCSPRRDIIANVSTWIHRHAVWIAFDTMPSSQTPKGRIT
jgi:hypothetical protein